MCWEVKQLNGVIKRGAHKMMLLALDLWVFVVICRCDDH